MNRPSLTKQHGTDGATRPSSKQPHGRFDDLPDEALIRQKELLAFNVTPFSASTLWRMCRDNRFPRPIRVSEAITAWRVGDIREWQRNPSGYRLQGAQQ